jgi:predicted RNA-binding Zn-ribbon protein involved in translation (DUF1610 family)
VTSINRKMGLKPAGKRSMMKLPTSTDLRTRLTSAKCPACTQTGMRLSKTQPGKFYCPWCNTIWEPEGGATNG